MLNNVERADPWAGVEGAEGLRAARAERRLTGLDEGTAWRDRDRRLLVARVEVFADADEATHRAVWDAAGAPALEAAWRARWAERDVQAGWVEARRGPVVEDGPELDRRVDWFEVEDHTPPPGVAVGDVTIYHHLTVWAGRMHVVLTVRHPLGDPPPGLHRLAATVADRASARLG